MAHAKARGYEPPCIRGHGLETHFLPSLLLVDGPAFSGTDAERHEAWRKQFESAFLAIGNMKRMARPDQKVYISYHVDLAEQLLRSFGRPMTIRTTPFLAACLAKRADELGMTYEEYSAIVRESMMGRKD